MGRRERDSNPRSGDRKAVFKTAAFNHSAIPPEKILFYASRRIPATRPETPAAFPAVLKNPINVLDQRFGGQFNSAFQSSR
jgi:hypothetical protein